MLSVIAQSPSPSSPSRRRAPARTFGVRVLLPSSVPRVGPVLVLDDDLVSGRSTARFVRAAVRGKVLIARTIHQAECLLRFGPTPSAIVTDFELQTSAHGVTFLERARQYGDIRAVVFTGAPQLAREALARSPLGDSVSVIPRDRGLTALAQWLGGVSECVALRSA